MIDNMTIREIAWSLNLSGEQVLDLTFKEIKEKAKGTQGELERAIEVGYREIDSYLCEMDRKWWEKDRAPSQDELLDLLLSLVSVDDLVEVGLRNAGLPSILADQIQGKVWAQVEERVDPEAWWEMMCEV